MDTNSLTETMMNTYRKCKCECFLRNDFRRNTLFLRKSFRRKQPTKNDNKLQIIFEVFVNMAEAIEYIWGQDGTGYAVKYCDGREITRHLIYTPSCGIRNAIYGYIHYISRHPASIQQVMRRIPVDGPSFSSTECIGFSLNLIRPKQSRPYLDRLIIHTVHEFLYDEINTDNNPSDILFMAKIGAIRDWTINCSICLEEKMGNARGWNDSCTRITIFKPCGHSVCTDCNRDLHKCPLCREIIIKTIEQNNVRFGDEIIEQLTDKVLNKAHIRYQ